MNLIWKLLKQNISVAQLIGFSLANFLGLFIIMFAIQTYNDISPLFNSSNTFFQKDYITISKGFSLVDAVSATSVGFSKSDIEELESQPFVKSIGTFKSSDFSVYGSINQAGAQFGSEMFFESVPDQFIDAKTDQWNYEDGDQIIPLILPKNYLDLYNFGFADARNMPKLTTNMAKMVTLDISIYGNGKQERMKAKIVAFSDRLNTILVPEKFIDFANQKYGSEEIKPARLILEVDNPANPEISKYFNQKEYNVEGDKASNSRVMSLLTLLISIVIGIGLIICVLSISILVLSIYLLIEKNTEKMIKLRLIGYTKNKVCKPYRILITVINISVFVLAGIGVLVSQYFYSPLLKSFWSDFTPSVTICSLGIGLIIMIFSWLFNINVINKKIK